MGQALGQKWGRHWDRNEAGNGAGTGAGTGTGMGQALGQGWGRHWDMHWDRHRHWDRLGAARGTGHCQLLPSALSPSAAGLLHLINPLSRGCTAPNAIAEPIPGAFHV